MTQGCGATKLQHSDFENGRWHLNDWSEAVRVSLGSRAWIWYCAAFVVVLAPGMVIACYSIDAHRPQLLVWVLFGFIGYKTSSTAPSGIGGMASALLAAIGLVLALIHGDWILLVCGILPGATWLSSCAILGTTAQYVIDAVRSSESCFETLTQQRILTQEASDDARGPRDRQ